MAETMVEIHNQCLVDRGSSGNPNRAIGKEIIRTRSDRNVFRSLGDSTPICGRERPAAHATSRIVADLRTDGIVVHREQVMVTMRARVAQTYGGVGGDPLFKG